MDIKNMSGIYLFCENKVLMMKRIKNDYNGEGKYFSIGGKFEKEELNNPKKCILRELEEETGIKENQIQDLKMKYLFIRNYNGMVVQNYFFFAELTYMPDLKQCKEGTFEWVPVAEIFDKPLPPSSKVCLEHYLKNGQYVQDFFVAVGTNVDGYGEYTFTNLQPFEDLAR